ncbi:hypothetical protein CsSME_00002519 [Camellia sinensis var. sinensis]
MALLGQLFLNKSMSWSEFQQAVEEGHKNREGQIRVRKPKHSQVTAADFHICALTCDCEAKFPISWVLKYREVYIPKTL